MFHFQSVLLDPEIAPEAPNVMPDMTYLECKAIIQSAQTRHEYIEQLNHLYGEAARNDFEVPDQGSETALHYAVISEDPELTRLLLSSDADALRISHTEENPLHWAASLGNLENVRLLLRAGGNPFQRSQQTTALNLAAKNGHIKVTTAIWEARRKSSMTTEIIANTASSLDYAISLENHDVAENLLKITPSLLFHRFEDGSNWLHIAAKTKTIDMIATLLSLGLQNVSAKNRRGETSLHIAASTGSEIVVSELLKAGADPTIRTKDDRTPLWEAVRAIAWDMNDNETDIVKALLVASPTIALIEGEWSPLQRAFVNGEHKLLNLLLSHIFSLPEMLNTPSSALHRAVWMDDLETTRSLLTAGNSVNATIMNDLTSLHLTALRDHEGMIDLLLEADADALSQSAVNQTPLNYASMAEHNSVIIKLVQSGTTAMNKITITDAVDYTSIYDYPDIVNTLIRFGADVATFIKPNGANFLIWTTTRGHEEIVRTLLKAGVNPSSQYKSGDRGSALHRATNSGRTRILKILLKYKADVSALASGKATPLHYAARKGPYETVVILLEKGFSLSARDDLGNTPLHLAAQRGEVAIVEAMLKANADPMATNNADMTVLQTAVRAGKCEVAKIIMQTTVRDQERADGTALHIAVAERNYGQVERLTNFAYTRAGAKNRVGATPLLIAAKLGDVKMMKVLLAGTKVTVETVLKDLGI